MFSAIYFEIKRCIKYDLLRQKIFFNTFNRGGLIQAFFARTFWVKFWQATPVLLLQPRRRRILEDNSQTF